MHGTPQELSEISKENWRAKLKPFLTPKISDTKSHSNYEENCESLVVLDLQWGRQRCNFVLQGALNFLNLSAKLQNM